MAKLQIFGPDIWIADGPAVTGIAGFRFPTRMAVIRLADGGLLIWSPVALSPAMKAEVEALGPVHHIVAPNSLHYMALPEWQHAFPAAKTHVAPGLSSAAPDIVVDAELGDAPPVDWAGDMDQAIIRGNTITTEVVFFHEKSSTAIFTDLLQQFPDGWFRGWRALVAKLDLMREAEPAVPRKFRLAFRDRAAAREGIAHILSWPAEKVLMAHGTPVMDDGRAFLERAFRWLTR
ncbi:MAG: DUF4336 domain-containing protein [Alphaproteobacteria bacterium]|nr:DUF4336 domain-containing protein [Alphaproteobacteria bacterium]MDX5417212.1 DUF4336 domain-containing protein [Alphaproteobacteria bacterium]MDX5494651.1 DUF4336 domain-containing protein [Alphaproteobacteria bacterium]